MKSILLFLALSVAFCYLVLHFEWGVAEHYARPNFQTQPVSFSRS